MRQFLARSFRVSMVLLLVVTAGLVAGILTMHLAIHGAEVQVPALKGMTVAEAHSLAAGLGLSLEVDNRYYSSDVAAGHILSQSPSAGTVVRREWHLRVAESLGAQKVDVPETVGSEERLATLSFRRVGLDVGNVVRLPMAGVADGTILAQDPPAHAQGISQPRVNLLVAAAPTADESPDGFLMPDLKGDLVMNAQAMLNRVGIHSTVRMVTVPVAPIGSGPLNPQTLIKPGAILSQQPEAGSRIEQSTVVLLTAAK